VCVPECDLGTSTTKRPRPDFGFCVIIIITTTTIIIVIIRYELGLDRSLSASSKSLLKGLPNRLLPFCLQFSILFGILLLLFILVTCHSQFYLYLLSFSFSWFSFQILKFLHFSCGQKGCARLFF
jgi:hypothetical protein